MMKKLVMVLALVISCKIALSESKMLKPVIAEVIYKYDNNDHVGFPYVKATDDTHFESVAEWKDRMVIYVKTADVAGFEKEMNEEYHKYKIIFFKDPFYDFNRNNCKDKTIVKEWTNIILSANLVADPKMQQEYLRYHATQFQKWPEVSQGFCNADFQQLLVFKTGRQLMLVISIPKGQSLDKLNPLTTKNNPRVNDWNNIMKKYQEGIEGTKKGEVWVVFKDVDQSKFIH